MTCRELTDFIVDYVEGGLPTRERAEFDGHLAACADCATYLRNYEETIRLGKDVCREEHDAVTDEVPEELVQAILAAKRRGS
jgi:anti-sigma factor RsiW